MTYLEERSRLLGNIRKDLQEKKLPLVLCPEPGLEDFAIFEDLSRNKFIFHKKEVTE